MNASTIMQELNAKHNLQLYISKCISKRENESYDIDLLKDLGCISRFNVEIVGSEFIICGECFSNHELCRISINAPDFEDIVLKFITDRIKECV